MHFFVSCSFYIILSGKFSVFVDPTKTGEDRADDGKQTTPEKKSNMAANTSPKHKLKRETLGKQVGVMSKRETAAFCTLKSASRDVVMTSRLSASGQAFGEIALISEDAKRNATIVAEEDSVLLTIDRPLFKATLEVSATF